MRGDIVLTRYYPKVPLGRRAAAFAIDFALVALVSTLLGGPLYILLFLLLWFVLRVLLVAKNQGQSLGRWALDMKVINPRFNVIPGLVSLTQREGITGCGAVLVLIGLVNLGPTNGSILFLPIPLLVDYGFALTDPEYRQAFHDRVAGTIVAQTQRGYSLDIKLKRLFAIASQRMK